MKIFPLAGLLTSLSLSSPVWAVYPPSTSMEETNSSFPKNGRLDPSTVQKFNEVTSRLEQKERILDDVIQNLQKDELSLKESIEDHKNNMTAPPLAKPPAQIDVR